jgi:hypothetical protein
VHDALAHRRRQVLANRFACVHEFLPRIASVGVACVLKQLGRILQELALTVGLISEVEFLGSV